MDNKEKLIQSSIDIVDSLYNLTDNLSTAKDYEEVDEIIASADKMLATLKKIQELGIPVYQDNVEGLENGI